VCLYGDSQIIPSNSLQILPVHIFSNKNFEANLKEKFNSINTLLKVNMAYIDLPSNGIGGFPLLASNCNGALLLLGSYPLFLPGFCGPIILIYLKQKVEEK
jgi:hypothetical protein